MDTWLNVYTFFQVSGTCSAGSCVVLLSHDVLMARQTRISMNRIKEMATWRQFTAFRRLPHRTVLPLEPNALREKPPLRGICTFVW